MPAWFNRLLDQSDPTMAAHVCAAVVFIVPYVGMTIAHGVWPSIAWDPQGYGIGAGSLTLAVGLGNWGGPKKP